MPTLQESYPRPRETKEVSCVFCHERFEDESLAKAIAKVEEHEAKCAKGDSKS